MRTVHTVRDPFEARVMAARLGAEGIVWALRGGLDGPYPFGEVEILVESSSWELASELLLADAVAEALGDDPA